MTLSSPPNETSPSPTSNASGSVLREYVSPTCKLQISAKASALEKWTRKPTLKNQRFLLSFEDPRLSEDQWVSLRGDRLKLSALTEAVTTYVQGFLSQSRSIAPLDSPSNLIDSETAPVSPSPQGISLQPKGLLAHSLNLGTIATEATGESLSLTSTQLADLASVLDEHGTATLDLPALNRDTAWMRSPMAWGKIAALSLLSVGITANVLNQFSPKKAPIQIASQASSSDQRLTPPQVPPPTPTPSVFISPGSSFPGQQVPPIGSSTPPIVADSNTGNSNTQDTSKPGTSKPDTTGTDSTKKSVGGQKDLKLDVAPENTSNPPPDNLSKSSKAPAKPAPQPLARRNSPTSDESAEAPEPPPIDLTPQIEAIQSKIPQQWKPPEKLSEDITYTLDIAANGSIISITPPEGNALPAAASVLPAVGTTIAPPLTASDSPYKVRIIFFTDGRVSAKKG